MKKIKKKKKRRKIKGLVTGDMTQSLSLTPGHMKSPAAAWWSRRRKRGSRRAARRQGSPPSPAWSRSVTRMNGGFVHRGWGGFTSRPVL